MHATGAWFALALVWLCSWLAGQGSEEVQRLRTSVMCGAVAEAQTAIAAIAAQRAAAADALFAVAWAQWRLGDFGAAAATIEKAVAKDARPKQSMLVLAERIRASGAAAAKCQDAERARAAERWPEAAALYEAAWRLDRWHGQALLAAFADWRRADAIDAEVALVEEHRSKAPELGAEALPGLQPIIDDVTARASGVAADLVARARAAIARSDWAGAEPLLERAGRLDAYNGEAYPLLQQVRRELGRPATRAPMFGGRGGRGPLAEAQRNGLLWLVNHQAADGRWVAGGANGGAEGRDVWVTALAILALVGDGHSPAAGHHAACIRRGLAWLRSRQDEQGAIVEVRHPTWLFDHAVATWALAEEAAVIQSEAMPAAVVHALSALVEHTSLDGALPCSPGGPANVATTLFAGMAYAFVPDLAGKPTVAGVSPDAVRRWWTSAIDPADGLLRPGTPPPAASGVVLDRLPATALGVVMQRLVTNEHPGSPPTTRTVQALVTAPEPTEASHSCFAAWAGVQIGSPASDRMRKHLDRVVATQQKAGDAAGSWNPVGPIAAVGGRVYSTAMHTMALQSFRYTPVRVPR